MQKIKQCQQLFLVCFYVPSADREIVVNTPLMKCPSDEVEASQAGFFNQEAVDALWAFEQEARKY